MTKPKLNRKTQQKQRLYWRYVWRALFTLVVLVLAGYILVRHWPTVRAGLHTARSGNLWWFVAALVCMAVTFCISAALYNVLALRRLRYVQTLFTVIAAVFVGRVLPAGLGNMGLVGVYLYRRGHTAVQATAVVLVNNALGALVHVLLLVAVLVFSPNVIRGPLQHYHVALPAWLVVVVLTAVGTALLFSVVRQRIAKFLRLFWQSVQEMSLAHVLLAVVFSVAMTATYVVMLDASARAVSVVLGPAQLLIVFSLGMLAGMVLPTPGGLVGTEAGLFAGFVAYGVSSSDAGAAVLLFRLVAYWLPLLPGVAALLVARQRHIV